jgi:DNA helicase-2/ATP-dependent DNA helicase PcrA
MESAEADGLPASVWLQDAERVKAVGRSAKHVVAFGEMLATFQKKMRELSPSAFVRLVAEESGYKAWLEKQSDGAERVANAQELVNAAAEYENRTESPTIEGFIEEISLVADVDRWDDRSNAVTLMTLHAAKGLEFDIVFMTGMEENLFPNANSTKDGEDKVALEEERRLCYVGITRAKKKLYLSWSFERRRYGETTYTEPSRFLDEIPVNLVDPQGPFGRREWDGEQDGWGGRRRKSSKPRAPKASVTASSRVRAISGKDDIMDALSDLQSKAPGDSLKPGQLVRHDTFGTGRIRSLSGFGDNRRACIAFTTGGERTLVLKYAKLEILTK